MKVEQWPVSRPIPYARNARKITAQAVDKVAASLKEFGWQQPIVVDSKDVIICGHTRLLAAHKLCMETVPVHVATKLSPAQVKAYRLMDNRSHQESTWDIDLLGPEFLELKELDIDLSLTGFDPFEVEGFLAQADASEGLTDPDACPEAPENPVTVLGDLWILGRHRLLCGDSTSIDAVERLMAGEKAGFIFTDPPYGVGFGYSTHNDDGGAYYADFMREVWHLMQSMDCPVVLTPGNVNVSLWMSLGDFDMACWVKKNAMSPASVAHLNIFEILLLSGVKTRRNTDLFEYSVKQQKGVGDHPCPKLMDLVLDVVESWAPPRATLFEPFGGSGTTLIACEKTGRNARLMEIDAKYCDVIITRWQDFTGKQAVLDGNGRTFKAIKNERFLIKLGAQDIIKEEVMEMLAQ